MVNNETHVSGYEMLGNNKPEVCCWAHSASQPLWEKDSEKRVGLCFFALINLKWKEGQYAGRKRVDMYTAWKLLAWSNHTIYIGKYNLSPYSLSPVLKTSLGMNWGKGRREQQFEHGRCSSLGRIFPKRNWGWGQGRWLLLMSFRI